MTTLKSTRARRGVVWLLLPTLLACVIAGLVLATYRYTGEQVASVKAAADAELRTVLDLHEGRLAAWHRERIANAVSLRNSIFVAASLDLWLRGGAPLISGERVEIWLRSLAVHYGYGRVAIARMDGTIAAEWPRSEDDRLPPGAAAAAAAAHEDGEPIIRRDDDAGHPPLARIFAPVYRAGDDASVATLVFEVQAETAAALATAWPVPRESAAVSVLSWDGTAWRYVLPASAPRGGQPLHVVAESEVAQLIGDAGVVHTLELPGHDHAVFAAARPVVGTPWAVLVQIDDDEVLALARARGVSAVLLVTLVSVLLAAGTAVAIAMLNRAARRREAALRSELAVSADVSEQKFRAAFRSSGLGSAMLDRDGVIIEANRALLELLGLTHDEVAGRRMMDLSAPEEHERAWRMFGELRDGERDYYRDERTYRTSDDRVAHVVLRVSAIRDNAGALQMVLALVEDVTEVKSLQAQLALADRMASVGTLAAGVAHEINNPLAFVLANIGYAEEELGSAAHDAAEVRQALAEAREGARRVRQIVMDLKTFAREDDRAASVTDVAEAIRFALSLAQNEIRHRARVEVHVADDLPRVRGSEHRIGQVLLNLLVNAAHAIEPGHASENVIVVCARRLPDGGAEVTVSDSGAGIAPDVVPRIFDPFFTTKPVGGGTGLGLAICHGIVSKLGGTLRVESVVGLGSTFFVALPPAVATAATRGADGDAGPGSSLGARVLVIDDEPLVARTVARVLGPGCHVDAARDGAAALSRIASDGAYDVVLCDLMMPETSGPELYALVAERHPELARRTVFVTGGAFTDEARAFLARVKPPLVHKPFEPAQLRAAVRSMLSATDRAAA